MTQLYFYPDRLSKEGVSVLASASWIAIWWITEAIPISATDLLPLVLFPLTGVKPIDALGNSFSDKMIFLFLGGFIIAVAIEKSNFHKCISLTIINKVGEYWNRVILGFMLATSFLSMWISNSTTAVIVLLIALSLINHLNVEVLSQSKMSRSLMLAIAYGCSIGGIARLIGTPTNLIFAGYIKQNYCITITFMEWMSIGLPFSMIMLVIEWFYLTKIVFRTKNIIIANGAANIKKELDKLGKMGYEEPMVLILFVNTAILWISRKYLIEPFIGGTSNALIGILGALVLFIIP